MVDASNSPSLIPLSRLLHSILLKSNLSSSKLQIYAPFLRAVSVAQRKISPIRMLYSFRRSYQPNSRVCCSAGAYLNFDLAYPSDAIPDDFFPSDEATYGYKVCSALVYSTLTQSFLQDFGIWNVTYETVSCTQNWPGARNAAALGSVANLGTGVCCPANPTVRPHGTYWIILNTISSREVQMIPVPPFPTKMGYRMFLILYISSMPLRNLQARYHHQ